MVVTQIIHFGAEQSLDQHGVPRTVDDKIQKAVQALKGVKTPQHFVLGTQVQDKGAIQITSEWASSQDYSTSESTTEYRSFINTLTTSCGKPQSTFNISLDKPAFGVDGPATAHVVEYVQVYFPSSLVTPSFQQKISSDFSRFEEIFRRAAKGDLGLAVGWVLEEQEHEDVEGGMAKCFFVMRGWEGMSFFEESVRSDAYKEAVQILLGWNAPFRMVSGCFYS
jgi:hypothetical protein